MWIVLTEPQGHKVAEKAAPDDDPGHGQGRAGREKGHLSQQAGPAPATDEKIIPPLHGPHAASSRLCALTEEDQAERI